MAEVLIILGIIGVVAAFTIPSLVSHHREKTTITQLQTEYAKLTEVFRLMIENHGTIDYYGDNGTERIVKLAEYLPKYMDGMEVCSRSRGCFNKYTNFHGDTITLADNIYQRAFRLKSGSSIHINMSGTCVQDTAMSQKYRGINSTTGDYFYISYGTYNLECGHLLLDINGKNLPNQSDKDLFRFEIVKDGLIPAGDRRETIWTQTFSNQCLGQGVYANHMGFCASWVLANKNMDYLHCHDLSWQGKTKCSR